ncbi:hypothetical protein NL676_000676 [Syzygium grande]|nr:hypothetical protein NL676_000676 [Syzygium grande]
MYLEDDALDLFAWINKERTLVYWEELVKALQENYELVEFHNPDEHLCGIRVFLNGLKEELRAGVCIHKPRTVYKAMSLALEFETKLGSGRGTRESNWSNLNRPPPAASSFPFRSTLVAGVQHVPTTANVNSDAADEQLVKHGEGEELEIDFAEILLHAILGKASGTTMELKGSLMGSPVLVLVDSGLTHNFVTSSLVASMNIPIEKIVPFGVQIRLAMGKSYDIIKFVVRYQYSYRMESAVGFKEFQHYLKSASFQAISKLNVTKSMVTPDLTKKNAFQWSKQADLTFDQLKTALTIVPVLGLPNFGHPFTVV